LYIWNLDGLKVLLKDGPLPAAMAIKYLLIYFALNSIGSMTALIVKTALTPADYTRLALTTAVFVWGVVRAYRANGGRDGRDFLGRLASLYFVCGLRFVIRNILWLLLALIVAMALVGFAIALIWSTSALERYFKPSADVVSLAITTAFLVALWSNLHGNLSEVAGASNNSLERSRER
jgi:hypothetical protein